MAFKISASVVHCWLIYWPRKRTYLQHRDPSASVGSCLGGEVRYLSLACRSRNVSATPQDMRSPDPRDLLPIRSEEGWYSALLRASTLGASVE